MIISGFLLAIGFMLALYFIANLGSILTVAFYLAMRLLNILTNKWFLVIAGILIVLAIA